VRSDRGCSLLWAAPGEVEPGPVFAAGDRRRGLRAIGSDETKVDGRGQRLPLAWRPGAVRADEHQLREDGAAVARHEQLRSDLANETTCHSRNPGRTRRWPPGWEISGRACVQRAGRQRYWPAQCAPAGFEQVPARSPRPAGDGVRNPLRWRGAGPGPGGCVRPGPRRRR
jgi:hypothetical protein